LTEFIQDIILNQKIEALNPLNVLSRGYSITTDKDGKVIKCSSMVNKDDRIITKIFEGTISSIVEKAEKNE